MMSNFDEAVEKACAEPTLLEALSWIAVWESERAIAQARKFFETGERTGSNGGGWDTCFKFCFRKVIERYEHKQNRAVSIGLQNLLQTTDWHGDQADAIRGLIDAVEADNIELLASASAKDHCATCQHHVTSHLSGVFSCYGDDCKCKAFVDQDY